MNVLGISGGTVDGNADTMVKAALEECEAAGLETKFLNISKKKIASCLDCGACKTGPCSQKDDMEGILKLLENADGIVLGSPTYFGTISSHMSLMMERSLPLRRQGFKLKNKVGGAVSVGGSRNGGQEFVNRTLLNWFTLHGMIAVGDDAPTAHFGGIGVGREPGDTEDDEAGLKTARNLGKHLAEVVQLIKK